MGGSKGAKMILAEKFNKKMDAIRKSGVSWERNDSSPNALCPTVVLFSMSFNNKIPFPNYPHRRKTCWLAAIPSSSAPWNFAVPRFDIFDIKKIMGKTMDTFWHCQAETQENPETFFVSHFRALM